MENETGPQHNYFLSHRGHFFTQSSRQRLVTIVFDIIGFTLSVGLVLMGYTYGKEASDRILANSSKATNEISPPIQSLTPTSLPQKTVQEECVNGFQRVSAHTLELCLPDSFVKEGNSNTSARFKSGDEEFVINTGTIEQFPIHMCHLEKNVIVGTDYATRTIFREEMESGCGEIVGFATTMYGTSKGDIQLHLWKESGTYLDEETYGKIESSIKL